MNQQQTPLWDAVVGYRDTAITPFHTPGHKLRSGVFSWMAQELGEGVFALDPSDEVHAFLNEHSFEQVLEQAQHLAAELFGTKHSLFLVNGTTSGIHCMLMAVEGRVVVPRFSHQSVYGGLMLAGVTPIFLPTSFDSEWGIPLPPNNIQVANVLKDYSPQAICLTYPSYYGTICDLTKLVSLSKAHNMMVLVDEAHGAHFHFTPSLPPSASQLGADAAVQSTHKTLGSLTQSSMLHCNNSALFEKVQKNLSILQTTSPSLIMLAVLDGVRKQLASSGRQLVDQMVELAQLARTQLSQIPGVQVLPETLQQDPTKLVFRLTKRGLMGTMVESLLRTRYNIQVELSDHYNVLALIGIGDTKESVLRLVNAVKELATTYKNGRKLEALPCSYPDIPRQVVGLRQTLAISTELVQLPQAKGRVSGAFLTPYPPGVPLVVPGEELTDEHIRYMLDCLNQGWHIRGIQGGNILVLKD